MSAPKPYLWTYIKVGQLVSAYRTDLQHDARVGNSRGQNFQKRRLYRELLTSELRAIS